MPEKPRRWFRFRLRTLLIAVFVASLPLAWVAYSLNWIRERHQFVRQGRLIPPLQMGGRDPVEAPAPGGLWIFGEHGIYPDFGAQTKELQEAQRLFPDEVIHDSGCPD